MKEKRRPTVAEELGVTYTEVNGYKIPNLTAEEKKYELGYWGRKRQEYLRNYRKDIYGTLIMKQILNQSLHETEVRAIEMQEDLEKKLKEQEGVTEELKAKDMMEWVGRMENISNRVREIVMNEVICQP